MSEIKNRMVLLAEQLRELTHGICKMAPGPYGIGVSTNAVSPLTAILKLTPEPFKEGNICLPGNQTCTVEMCAFTEEQRALRTYLTTFLIPTSMKEMVAKVPSRLVSRPRPKILWVTSVPGM